MDFSASKAMPKKRNPFFMFMLEKRKELEAAGEKFPGGYKDIAARISEEWTNMKFTEKQRFIVAAEEYNKKIGRGDGVNQGPLASTGVTRQSLKEFEEMKEKKAFESKQLILDMIEENKNNLAFIPIIIAHFSTYWTIASGDGTFAIPSEVGLTAFNIHEGIMDNYSSLIDPGLIPEDEFRPYLIQGEIERSAKAQCIPVPKYSDKLQKYREIAQALEIFVFAHAKRYHGQSFIFCLNSEMTVTESCLKWLLKRSGHTELNDIKVLSLDFFIHRLSLRNDMRTPTPVDDIAEIERTEAFKLKEKAVRGHVVTPPDCPLVGKGLFIYEKHVDMFLSRNNYAHYKELACFYHIQIDEGCHLCAQNIANRYAYSLLDVMTPNFKVIPQSGKHYPSMDNPEKEIQKRLDMFDRWAEEEYYVELIKDYRKREEEEPGTIHERDYDPEYLPESAIAKANKVRVKRHIHRPLSVNPSTSRGSYKDFDISF